MAKLNIEIAGDSYTLVVSDEYPTVVIQTHQRLVDDDMQMVRVMSVNTNEYDDPFDAIPLDVIEFAAGETTLDEVRAALNHSVIRERVARTRGYSTE